MNAIVKRHSISSHRRSRPITGSRALPFIAACLATLLGLPVNAAVLFPDNPLQTGAAYPPPNVMFILDDSGSMQWDFMPGSSSSSEVPATSPDKIQLKAYTRNTLYYNPNTTYRPWLTGSLDADGNPIRKTGGTSYTSVYSSDTALSGSQDLSSNTQTFYVPKSDATDLSDSRQYDRYDIKKVSGTVRVMKSGTVTGAWEDQDVNEGKWVYFSLTVPSGATRLDVSAVDNNDDGDLYVRRGSQPTDPSETYDCRDTRGKSKSCGVDNPTADTWYIGIYGANDDVNNIDISYTVAFSSYTTPTGRSETDEIKNYATWYSYYRTRNKMAKGAASEAFGQMGSNIRVGYDTIWNRKPYDIPVNTNDGKFTGTNRSDWFDHLQNAGADNGTPLRSALKRAGEYYRGKGNSDPWGPGTGNDRISCRQSFAILTTDGYWNSDDGFNIGDVDAADGNVITAKDGVTTGQYKAEPPYSDKNGNANSKTYSNTLADVANYYWKRDLNDLDNNVPDSTSDPAFWQHMTTFSLAIGQSGTLDPDADLVSIKNGSKYWPKPVADTATAIDDLWHAAVNGHGTFVAASSPTKFAQALVDALATVAARNGSASNVTANSTSFQSDTAVYQASYVSGKWTGELASYAVSSAGVATDAEGNPLATWKASEHIPAYPGRTILTWNGTAGATFPTTAQASALARSTGLAPVTGDDNAKYIMGDQTKERQRDGLLRDRILTVLGDIADSSPLFLKEGTTQTIFVGANDGMLHAFNAATGVEQFGFIPGGISMASLASLSDPQYVHKWFVDGPIVVSTKAQTSDHNYLVGALGRGGNGLFGLDVTSPSTFDATNVKWDLTGSAAPADMGQVLGEPLIVKFNDGTTGIVVSNGVNSSTGAAALFIMDITTGNVVKELDTGATGGNGLSAPRGWDNDGNGTVDYVYAGDLKGNLWKFDLSGTSNTDWKVGNGGNAMFVAKDTGGNLQPITTGLALAKDPSTGKRWVFIGTGSFMTQGDVTDMSVQSMYGLIDDDSTITGRSELQKREIVEIDATEKYRGFEANGTLDSSKKGWYIDLLTPPDGTAEGERIVNRPLVRGTVLVTASMIPPTGETCEAGGRGYINALDAFTGTSTKDSYFDTNNNGDFTDDTIGSGTSEVPIGSVDLGVGMPTLPTIIDNLLVVGGSTGSMGQIKVNPQGAGARRISWREILRD
jgi:type IV pilus assembly protein PilY1